MSKKAKSDKKKKAERLKQAKALASGSSPVASSLAGTLVQAARSLRTVQSRLLAECGLYAGQEGVIMLLSAEDGLTPGQLAQKLGVKAPTMTRTIGRMEVQGFVERRASQEDARLTKVFLTEAGRATLLAIEAANAGLERQATRGLSGKEIKGLFKLLEVLEVNLQATAGAQDEEKDDL
ncbi:MarR family winged helix-turn-helix transcriptional regulator [Allorhizobium undicola]|uniref:MarR family winged helix-turn-helix transcriptional regulator n=1 Tax=Allorhizobium undicola TaxID=78527 RepID=UPI000485EE60|nr:MarR family winged helix-turn-helix transcriptional regulator [Allorhizobium undicola]